MSARCCFYRKDIPVLFFFTGLHSDYHKPSDDADKINYIGMLKIIRFIQQMIEADKQDQKLAFTKTREQQTSTSTRFSVSMGIKPEFHQKTISKLISLSPLKTIVVVLSPFLNFERACM